MLVWVCCLLLKGIRETDIDEVPDCKINEPKQGSKDVCRLAKVESLHDTSLWIHPRLRSEGRIGNKKDVSSGSNQIRTTSGSLQGLQAFSVQGSTSFQK